MTARRIVAPRRRFAAALRSLKRRRAGFTLIEVMVSLSVMTVGAMAILALQQHSIRSNAHARELTTALQIAQIWSERLKEDAATWNDVGVASGTPSAATVLGNTKFLNMIVGTPNVFQGIPNTIATASNAYDYQGYDVSNANNSNYFYCASMRLAWVYFGRAMRADVRVWWPRSEGGNRNSIMTDFAGCVDDGARLNPGGSLESKYHMVYLPSVIRMTVVDN